MKIVDRGVIFQEKVDLTHQSNTFPGICILPNGIWLCGFSSAPTKSVAARHFLLTYSVDEGRTWSRPVAPFKPSRVDGRPGNYRVGYMTSLGGERVLATLAWVDQTDPSLPFFNDTTEGLLDMKIFLAESSDRGLTWSQPRILDSAPFDMPTPITGPMLRLPSKEWACQFELNKHYHDTTPWRHCSILMFSKDEGRTWGEHAVVSDDPGRNVFYWDQRPGVLDDGRILNVFWTFDRVKCVYKNIHTSESRDSGRTWSKMRDAGIPGQPAAPVSLPDGRVALVYMDRSGSPTLKLRASNDGGLTWPANTELVLHETILSAQTVDKYSMQDTWDEMVKFSVGLPATTRTSEGDLIVTYYSGRSTDQTNIEWVRVRI